MIEGAPATGRSAPAAPDAAGTRIPTQIQSPRVSYQHIAAGVPLLQGKHPSYSKRVSWFASAKAGSFV